MITAEQAWEVAVAASQTFSLVAIDTDDEQTFVGRIQYVHRDYIIIDGLGYANEMIESIYLV